MQPHSAPAALSVRLPEILARADDLPSLPAVAVQVLELARSEDPCIDELADTIARDPALVAKLLKLANSPLFNGGAEITSIRQATMTLGLKTVQLMSLSFSLANSLPKQGSRGSFHYPIYWRRCLTLAVAGRALGERVDPGLANEAFVCGLLGNIGQLVLATVFEQEYDAVMEAAEVWPTAALELEMLGFRHTDVGAMLLEEWKLPETIHGTVAYAERPGELPEDVDAPTSDRIQVMQMAALAVGVICDGDKSTPLIALNRIAKRRGIEPKEITALLLALETDVTEAAELLEIELPAGCTHAEVMEEARNQILAISLGQAGQLKRELRKNDLLKVENRSLTDRATRDGLTGVANRATLDRALAEEQRLAAEDSDRPCLGLLMIDVDHFKAVNDDHGHPAGDEVLRVLGRVLTQQTRGRDLAARYGGEEFVVLMRGATAAGLAALAERIRRAVARTEVTRGDSSLSVTISLGAARSSEAPVEELVALADRRLYTAKQTGRDRTVLEG